MSATMTLPTLSNPRTFLSKAIERDHEAFCLKCFKSFDSAEHMASELSSVGYVICPKRCQRIRNRKVSKTYAAERKAVKFALRRRKALEKAAETDAEIESLQARIAELKAAR